MKKHIFSVGIIFLVFSCAGRLGKESIYVENIHELNAAIAEAAPGDEIILSNGVWNDAQIKFYGKGTKEMPITLQAETPGSVFLEGQSFLHLGGENLVVNGLYFRNGFSPDVSILRYKIGKDTFAFNCRVTNCAIENFTKPSRLVNDRWIEFYGKNNKMDHCYIEGKSNDGETLRVFQDGNENSQNHHQIVHNYFGPRPRKGGPRGETIRIGDSKTSMTPGFVNVSDNYFEACNGEVEIISDKTNFNSFRSNIFYKCEGSLVLRHGNFATIDGNIFIGDDDSDFYGGVRVVNTGHLITNNYFYKINGSKFRSPLAIMNGIPKSPINRYKQVTDVVIAYNTWVDCKSPIQVGVGQNIESSSVLPPSEIRSAPPIRSIIANNLIFNHAADDTPTINHDNMDGVKFHSNLIDNNGEEVSTLGTFQHHSIRMKQLNDWLFAPEENQSNAFSEVYKGYGFDRVRWDLFGSSRSDGNSVGAISELTAAEGFEINKKKFGPSWYSTDVVSKKANVINVSAKDGELANKIAQAEDGDMFLLTDKVYTINTSLEIGKNITIFSEKAEEKAQLIFVGGEDVPAFEMNPYGTIRLENVSLRSKTNQMAFAPLKQNMSAAYNLFLDGCSIDGFYAILSASKGSFADTIKITNTNIQNCKSGITLAAESKGDYNAEMVIIEDCEFVNVQSDVIHYFRGGYDESTIGGSLTILNSTFKNCGSQEKSETLLKTRGIVNVIISGNTFQDNPVKLVALLWGEKNNRHEGNSVFRSGQIKVEEQLKLDLLY